MSYYTGRCVRCGRVPSADCPHDCEPGPCTAPGCPFRVDTGSRFCRAHRMTLARLTGLLACLAMLGALLGAAGCAVGVVQPYPETDAGEGSQGGGQGGATCLPPGPGDGLPPHGVTCVPDGGAGDLPCCAGSVCSEVPGGWVCLQGGGL